MKENNVNPPWIFVTLTPYPEAKCLLYYTDFRQVFWLVPYWKAFPLRCVSRQWQNTFSIFNGTYSCGYSSGIAPDSLLLRLWLL